MPAHPALEGGVPATRTGEEGQGKVVEGKAGAKAIVRGLGTQRLSTTLNLLSHQRDRPGRFSLQHTLTIRKYI